MTGTFESGPSTRASIDRLLRPRSVAIVGASSTATSFGASVLMNLEDAKFNGDLYLINPKRSEIHGRPCLPSIDALPLGVDCAVLAIPRSSVLEAVAACARQGVGAVIVFSSGFAESGPQGRYEQEEIAAIAKEHGMIVEGPNCLGMVNFIDGIPLTFVLTPPAVYAGDNGVAVISQSGAMAAVVGVGLRHRELGVSFSVSTGNEAVSFVEDFVEYLLEDSHTKVLLMIVEKFRRPQKLLALAAHARMLGKFIVLLHPGRSSAARASAETHTGAMAGDYQVMRTKVTHAGVVVVETLEELLDVSEMLLRFPSLPSGGAAVLTESGAFKALSLDFCERVGLPLPGLSDATSAALRHVLPEFIPPTNPLDITAQGLVDPDLYRRTLPLILADERFGSLVLAIILTDEPTSGLKFPPILAAIRETKPSKPIVFAGLDEGAKVLPEYIKELRELGVPFFPTPERAFRALSHLTSFARVEARLRSKEAQQPHAQGSRISNLPSGVIPEYKSKEVLHALGIRIPEGTLARTAEEAKIAAAQLGYPVALKAQSAQLSHKSDAGGVELNLNDEEQLEEAWFRMQRSVSRKSPELVLDGILVEKMGAPGIELIVGVRNDPDWGAALLIGMGGVFAEALNDVRLIPPDLPVEVIVEEILQLKCARLLSGFRGSPAIDVKAVADVVYRLGVFALTNPQIREIDINPLVAYANEGGTLALDALIVTQ
ncbi:MAG: acetate--CoA ligase family protein [Terracidiphilus sp.]